MSEIIESSNNVEPGAIVEPQNTVVQDTGASTTPQVDSASATQKPVQDSQTNAAFAEMRRQNEKLQRDYDIARQYGQYGIYTEEDYQAALAAQEAQQLGVDPQFYQEFNVMKNQLGSIQREKTLMEQDSNLRSDPIRGELYKSWEGEVKQVSQNAGVDYRTAFNYLLDKKLPDLLNSQRTSGQQEAIRSITQNAQTSPGALGLNAGNAPKKSIKDMTVKESDDIAARVKRGEKVYL